MFDIVSFIRERIFRRPKLVPLAGEELSEKQTTKLGYFLLYCMFAAILMSAQWTLSIIKDIPDKPEPVPYCVTTLLSNFGETPDFNGASGYANYGYDYRYNYNYGYDGGCSVISSNPPYDLNPEYQSLVGPSEEITTTKNTIQNLESQKQQLERGERGSQQDYDTSLTEKIANENSGLYEAGEIRKNIRDTRSTIANLDSQIGALNAKIEGIRSKYSQEVKTLLAKAEKANEDYKNAYLLYRIYVGILSFVFAIIVFAVLYRGYIGQKMKNSPHTVIFSVATFAYGLVLLQVSAMFIWDIIPHKLLNWIMGLFAIFTPLVYLVQFLWPILIIAVFGYLVFRIQKRLYSPQNVLKRVISDKKCPGCGNAIDLTKPFCPLCAHEIQVRCPDCKSLSLKGMPYCANCGKEMPAQK
jgi:hypothetical protein